MTSKHVLALLAALGLLAGPLAEPASANMYVCKDKRTGRTWFTNVKKKGQRCRLAMQFQDTPSKATPSRKTSGFSPKVGGLPHAVNVDSTSLQDRKSLYDPYIKEASARYRIPESFIKGVIRVESRFKYNAVSPVGAQGLMQLMPRTARAMGVTDAFDPRQNIFGGTRLLRYLANKHKGDLVAILSAYHAGSGAVSKKGGIPYAGTEGYVRAVLKHYYAFKDAPTAAVSNP